MGRDHEARGGPQLLFAVVPVTAEDTKAGKTRRHEGLTCTLRGPRREESNEMKRRAAAFLIAWLLMAVFYFYQYILGLAPRA